ncbi:MAG: histidinol-phosphatase [Lachnospiraceae bacterium]|nr:histidinol-phosphatase [uncultured Acetatifactor sp.]MCI8287303.1 histidinol-phosphatase [Lachnospiraceae bacterium]
MKTNFHTHTQRCRHAQGSEEDFIKEALTKGLSQLGFSDHAPYPDVDFGRRMLYEELEDYLETVERLQGEYREQIHIRRGLEIEYLPAYRGYYEELLAKQKVEYLLLGAHFYMDTTGKRANTYEISSSTREYIAYAETIAEGMRTGLFRAVAHPDLYMLNHFAWDENCKRAADLLIDTAVITDTILEYNANGLRWARESYPEGVRPPYPYAGFWQMVAKSPVRVIVGSDCHEPSSLWDEAIEQSYRNLEALGIEPVRDLFAQK